VDKNGVKKRTAQRTSVDSVMLMAMIVSIVVHFSIIYFVPAVQTLPLDTGYIEVEPIKIDSEENVGQKTGENEQPGVGEVSEQSPPAGQIPKLNQIPTQLEAVEPRMVESNSDIVDRELTFVGKEPRLPANLQTLPQVKPRKNDQPAPIHLDASGAELFPAEEIVKQAPESKSSVESDIQLHDERPLTAEQRYEPILRPQTVQIPEDKVSPGFTKRQTRELIENNTTAVVSLSKIERTSPDKISPVLARGEVTLAQLEKRPTPSGSLPKTPEIVEHAQDDNVIPADKTISVASEHPNREALTRRFEAPKNSKDALEVLPKTVIPKFAPGSQLPRAVEPNELTGIPHPRTALPLQELPPSRPASLPTPETKVTFAPRGDVTEKQPIPAEEMLVKAVEQPLPQQRLNQGVSQQATPDEPRSVHIQQDLQAERHVQRETDLSIPLQRAGVKRSFGLDGASGSDLGTSHAPQFGIFVGKDTMFLQPQQPDVTVPQNDVLERAATTDQANGESAFVIEGPASERKVISKPARLPELQIDVEVTIRLKFWVLPDGTVGEVIPLQRGDVRLERAAIQYLKSWRFTPVSPDKPTVWGIIPIKYQLK